MNILITGGAGFIGSHLVEFHLQQGDDVCVVGNLSTGSEANIAPFRGNPHFTFEKDNLLTWSHLGERTVWAHRIYHLAAMVGMYHLLANPVQTLTTNILDCERLLRVMDERGSKARLLQASSSEIYGPSDKTSLSEGDLLLFKASTRGKWGYAASKYIDELFALTYAREKGIKATAIRLFNTIGPRQNAHYGMVVPRFVGQAVRNEPITVYGDGEQTRSFCDVRDVVVCFNAIANQPDLIGDVVNLGQDQPISMNQLAVMVKRLAHSDSVIQHVTYEEAYGPEYEDIMQRRPDLTKLHKMVSCSYQWDLERTLRDLIHLKRGN